MRKRFFTYAKRLMLVTGFLLSSCSSWHSLTRNNPKVIQLGPEDCPWNESCIIRNVPERKTYGREYARKQNKQLRRGDSFF
ncbi:MAG: hypothetical protein V2I54_13820 [Bacteroidales bacterium]|nr:hypothetical protein [Bacteroidales bacterium]